VGESPVSIQEKEDSVRRGRPLVSGTGVGEGGAGRGWVVESAEGVPSDSIAVLSV
jgi:hypothetical protein